MPDNISNSQALLAAVAKDDYKEICGLALLGALGELDLEEAHKILKIYPEVINFQKNNFTPLIIALIRYQIGLVKLMLGEEFKADVNLGLSALYVAAEIGRWDMFEIMLQERFNPNVNMSRSNLNHRWHGITVFKFVLSQLGSAKQPNTNPGLYAQIKQLIKKMLEPRFKTDVNFYSENAKSLLGKVSSLWFASYFGQWDIVETMLGESFNPNINFQDENGIDVLHFAISTEQHGLVERMIKEPRFNTDINIYCKNSNSKFFHLKTFDKLILAGKLDLVKYILDNADRFKPDIANLTPNMDYKLQALMRALYDREDLATQMLSLSRSAVAIFYLFKTSEWAFVDAALHLFLKNNIPLKEPKVEDFDPENVNDCKKTMLGFAIKAKLWDITNQLYLLKIRSYSQEDCLEESDIKIYKNKKEELKLAILVLKEIFISNKNVPNKNENNNSDNSYFKLPKQMLTNLSYIYLMQNTCLCNEIIIWLFDRINICVWQAESKIFQKRNAELIATQRAALTNNNTPTLVITQTQENSEATSINLNNSM